MTVRFDISQAKKLFMSTRSTSEELKVVMFTFVLSCWAEDTPIDFEFELLVFLSKSNNGVKDGVLVCSVRLFTVICRIYRVASV